MGSAGTFLAAVWRAALLSLVVACCCLNYTIGQDTPADDTSLHAPPRDHDVEVAYDHIFSESGPAQTTIRFVVDAEGWSLPLVGGIFRRIYRKNLDRAVPLLIQEIEAAASLKR